jgi:hypothetical protein
MSEPQRCKKCNGICEDWDFFNALTGVRRVFRECRDCKHGEDIPADTTMADIENGPVDLTIKD